MIKNVLIPESIGSYYIFSKRILGFDVGKTHVRVTQLLLKGNNCIVERWFEQAIQPGTPANYTERAAQAIQAVLKMVDPYDAVHTLIPSSLVIFKDLKMPFSAYNKIKMVIDFEVEPLLPFAAADAVIDFIITSQSEDGHSELLVAAVQKQHLANHIQLFAAAGVSPSIITVDFFALYGLYKNAPSYANKKGNVALIDVGSHETGIAYLHDDQLKSIRTLPKGLITLAKTISSSLKIDPNSALETLVRFGVNNSDDVSHTVATTDAFAPFLDEILFTFHTFIPYSDGASSIDHIYLLGDGSTIHGIHELIQNKTGIRCESLNVHTLLEGNKFSIAHKNGISDPYIMSLSAAASSLTLPAFNLRQKEFSPSTNTSLFYKQVIVASTLFIGMLCALGIFYFVETRKLTSAANEAEQEAKEALKDQFKNLSEESSLDDMVEEAQDEIKKEEKLWSAFSPTRASMLQYLLELTNRIDQEALQFTIDKLQITDHTMKITAHVKDYDALLLLEKELRQSKLFSFVEEQNDPNFTMTIKLVPNT
jgi:type IV pilus assembly protein PilM